MRNRNRRHVFLWQIRWPYATFTFFAEAKTAGAAIHNARKYAVARTRGERSHRFAASRATATPLELSPRLD